MEKSTSHVKWSFTRTNAYPRYRPQKKTPSQISINGVLLENDRHHHTKIMMMMKRSHISNTKIEHYNLIVITYYSLLLFVCLLLLSAIWIATQDTLQSMGFHALFFRISSIIKYSLSDLIGTGTGTDRTTHNINALHRHINHTVQSPKFDDAFHFHCDIYLIA